MEQKSINNLYDSFSNLIRVYGFSKLKEVNDQESYLIDYGSDNFVIELEKYRREFYVILFKTGHNDSGVNLFNLLSYLNQDSTDTPTSNYFKEEKDLEESYKKQFNHISNAVYDNFDKINDFFANENYKTKLVEIRQFMVKKYPGLFGGI